MPRLRVAGAFGLVSLLGLVIAACQASQPPRAATRSLPAALRAVPGYPLRRPKLTEAARLELERALEGRWPGWKFRLDDHTGLLSQAVRGEGAWAPLTAEDLPELRAFLAANHDVVGLRANEIPELTPIVKGDRVVLLQPPDERYRIEITKNALLGSFLPGWRAWPAPLADDVLLAPYVGRVAAVHHHACPSGPREDENRPCDPVGPNDCQGPAMVEAGTRPIARRDLSFSPQRYWNFFRGAPGTIDFRFIGELRLDGRRCSPSNVGGVEEILSSQDLPPYVDLITGEGIADVR